MLLHLAAELRRRGHTVVPVGPANGCGWLGDEFRKLGFEPDVYVLNRPIDFQCIRDLRNLLDKHRIDVVHSHEFTMAVYGAAAVGSRPHIVTMHGGTHYARRARRRWALRWAMKRSQGIVAVSHATRDRLREVLGFGEGDIEVIWNGVPEPQQADGSRMREELGLSPRDVLAVAVGNLYPVKGHIFLAQALSAIRRASPELPIHVVVAGRGDERGHIEAYLEEQKLGGHFRLLGFRDDVPSLLAAADIYVMPSLSEGLPLALVEAMLAGKPIIASRVGGIPEVLSDGHNGLLVGAGNAGELATALSRLAADRALRLDLGRHAREVAEENLTVARMTDRYLALYDAAMTAR